MVAFSFGDTLPIYNPKTTMTDKEKIKAKIEEIIAGLERCHPNPLGSMEQCLAAAEIEALNLVKDYINSLS